MDRLQDQPAIAAVSRGAGRADPLMSASSATPRPLPWGVGLQGAALLKAARGRGIQGGGLSPIAFR